MRYQGRISEWKDDRGFGFIAPNGGGERVFVHISAFRPNQRRPGGNELVTYELVRDAKKGCRAADVAFVGLRPTPPVARRRGILRPLVPVLVASGLGFFAWQEFTVRKGEVARLPERALPAAEVPRLPASARPAAEAVTFRCEGKTRCTEMTSCAEATFYLRNCPGVNIDGDRDGIPCEDQLCGH